MYPSEIIQAQENCQVQILEWPPFKES